MYAKNTKSVSVEPLFFENYIRFIRESVGSGLFQHFYCNVNGTMTEVLDNGRLSCATYVSFILKLFSLISEIQITVHRTMDDMLKSGWTEIKEPKPGAIIVWAEKASEVDQKSSVNASSHKHIGFYIGNGQAVSNSSMLKSPVVHLWDFRPVYMILWHSKLEEYGRRGVDYTRKGKSMPEGRESAPVEETVASKDVLANQ